MLLLSLMMVKNKEHTKLGSWGWVVVLQMGWVKVYTPIAVPLCELGPHVNTHYPVALILTSPVHVPKLPSSLASSQTVWLYLNNLSLWLLSQDFWELKQLWFDFSLLLCGGVGGADGRHEQEQTDAFPKLIYFGFLRPCSQLRHLVMTNNAYYYDNCI